MMADVLDCRFVVITELKVITIVLTSLLSTFYYALARYKPHIYNYCSLTVT